MNGLLNSRRFVTLLFDVVVSSVMFVVATYAPAQQDLIKFFVVSWQPVFIAVIGAYTIDDNNDAKTERAKIEANTSIAQTKIYAAEPGPK
jgi:hypothetical protein